jgi:hypothetical protein
MKNESSGPGPAPLADATDGEATRTFLGGDPSSGPRQGGPTVPPPHSWTDVVPLRASGPIRLM